MLRFPSIAIAGFAVSCWLVVAGPVAGGSASNVVGDGARQPDFSSWYAGAEGLTEALRRSEAERKPLLLYFYTDWCGYCRQFERELLTEPELADYLKSIVAVRVNPEAGPAEAVLARRYGVHSFPTLFVHSGESPVVSQIDRVRVVDGRPVLMSPGLFIDVVKTAGAR
jgi:thiol:disulfide interchange protein